MTLEIYWIEVDGPGRLAIMPKPEGFEQLEEEIRSLARAGVGTLVSMIPPDEASIYGLQDEGALARRLGLQFHCHPVADHQVPPSSTATWTLARALAREFQEGGSIAVHCYAGIGRSALMLACILVSLGLDPDSAWATLSRARGFAVPETFEQRDWVRRTA